MLLVKLVQGTFLSKFLSPISKEMGSVDSVDALKIGRLLFQTPHGAEPGQGTKPHLNVSGDLQVRDISNLSDENLVS